jgi:hypothetical protein
VFVLHCGSAGAATPPPQRPIAVELCDLQRLAHDVSRTAQAELQRTFDRIGVDVKIRPCGERADALPADALRIAIVVLPLSSRGPRAPAIALGATSPSPDPIVWIFFHRVERVARRAGVDRAIVLGHVMAHEIAHVLIPEARHGRSGLMRATWRSAELVDAVQGQLRFSADEASAIRNRLAPSPAPGNLIAAASVD